MVLTPMSVNLTGQCVKMPAQLDEQGQVSYSLKLGAEQLPLNEFLEKSITIEFDGAINCIECGKKTKKSFSQGYCFGCMKTLPQCDQCIMSPERCHYHAGTCRDTQWADQFCMTDHIVYLANTSAPKVGITRISQIPTRWIDQGAEQALPIYRVSTRQQSGFVEDVLREHIADKTNWRNMLKSNAEPIDLIALRDSLFAKASEKLTELETQTGLQAVQKLEAEVVNIQYPVLEYPKKITSFNLDKIPRAEGVLRGIKGQYLMLDTGVINLRKYTGYQLKIALN